MSLKTTCCQGCYEGAAVVFHHFHTYFLLLVDIILFTNRHRRTPVIVDLSLFTRSVHPEVLYAKGELGVADGNSEPRRSTIAPVDLDCEFGHKPPLGTNLWRYIVLHHTLSSQHSSPIHLCGAGSSRSLPRILYRPLLGLHTLIIRIDSKRCPSHSPSTESNGELIHIHSGRRSDL